MLDRPVGLETRKSYQSKVQSGFFDRYLSGGAVLEIGFAGHDGDTVTVVPQAIGIERDFPGYDGLRLPFPEFSQDAVYSSHCLEHIRDRETALREWFRVLKVGGYLVLAVPHQHLFERRERLPSRWNIDHKHFYTPSSLLALVEKLFEPNAYRIRHMCDNDAGFDYSVLPTEGGSGCFEIELVLQKMPTPRWEMDDGASRRYGTEVFQVRNGRTEKWWLSNTFDAEGCWMWGPYMPIKRGRYAAIFFVEPVGLITALRSAISFDVAANYGHVLASKTIAAEQGADELKTGMVRLEFDALADGDVLYEFRISSSGRPFNGELRFHGLELKGLGKGR